MRVFVLQEFSNSIKRNAVEPRGTKVASVKSFELRFLMGKP